MTQRKPPETDNDVLTVLTELFCELDVESNEEAEQILRAAGYTPSTVRTNARNLVNQALATSPLNWRNQKSAITKLKEQIIQKSGKFLSRLDMEAKVKELLSLIPPSQLVATHFRDFKEMTDADLASWIEDLSMLLPNTDRDNDEQHSNIS